MSRKETDRPIILQRSASFDDSIEKLDSGLHFGNEEGQEQIL